MGRCAGRVRGTELSLLFSIYNHIPHWFSDGEVNTTPAFEQMKAKYVTLSDYYVHLHLFIIILRLFETCCDLLLSIMSLGENILTYSVANIMAAIFSLYSVLFRILLREDIDHAIQSVYVNRMKAVSGKMLTKPLLFKYYCVNISF